MFNVASLDTFTDLVIEEKLFILFLSLRMDLLSWVIFYPVYMMHFPIYIGHLR